MDKLNIEYKRGKDGLLYPQIDFGQREEPLGKYGSLRAQFLKEHKPDTYAEMLMDGTLLDLLYDIDEQAHKMISILEKQYLKSNPLPASGDFMKTLQIRNNARTYAEEIVGISPISCKLQNDNIIQVFSSGMKSGFPDSSHSYNIA